MHSWNILQKFGRNARQCMNIITWYNSEFTINKRSCAKQWWNNDLIHNLYIFTLAYLHQVRSYGRSFSFTILWARIPNTDFSQCDPKELAQVLPLNKVPFIWTYLHADRVRHHALSFICYYPVIRQFTVNIVESNKTICIGFEHKVPITTTNCSRFRNWPIVI